MAPLDFFQLCYDGCNVFLFALSLQSHAFFALPNVHSVLRFEIGFGWICGRMSFNLNLLVNQQHKFYASHPRKHLSDGIGL